MNCVLEKVANPEVHLLVASGDTTDERDSLRVTDTLLGTFTHLAQKHYQTLATGVAAKTKAYPPLFSSDGAMLRLS